MAHLHAGERLTAEDAAFLYLEKEEMPLHIGSVSVFEGVIPFESLVEYVASRLPLIPRYRQRLVEPPLHIGHPTWEADPEFKVQNHVHLETLARGTETELRELAGRIFSRVMDRNQPLWDLTLVHGLRGRRCGLIARVHHCLADGVSGAGLMNVMLNADGCAPAADPQGAPFEPSAPPAGNIGAGRPGQRLVGSGGTYGIGAIGRAGCRAGALERPGAAESGSTAAAGAGIVDSGAAVAV